MRYRKEVNQVRHYEDEGKLLCGGLRPGADTVSATWILSGMRRALMGDCQDCRDAVPTLLRSDPSEVRAGFDAGLRVERIPEKISRQGKDSIELPRALIPGPLTTAREDFFFNHPDEPPPGEQVALGLAEFLRVWPLVEIGFTDRLPGVPRLIQEAIDLLAPLFTLESEQAYQPRPLAQGPQTELERIEELRVLLREGSDLMASFRLASRNLSRRTHDWRGRALAAQLPVTDVEVDWEEARQAREVAACPACLPEKRCKEHGLSDEFRERAKKAVLAGLRTRDHVSRGPYVARDDLEVKRVSEEDVLKGRSIVIAYTAPHGGAGIYLTPEDARHLAEDLLRASAKAGS